MFLVSLMMLTACGVVVADVSFGSPQYFQNKVDHTDATSNATYAQKFYVIDEFVDANNSHNAPTFFFLGGEAPVEFFEFQEVSAVNWAKNFSARYIALEHRYYGTSLPTPTYDTASLTKYLTVEQALADAAAFVTNQIAQNNYTGPWVVFGCSYSGALSAWFRYTYPHLVVGSVAPSGPVLAQYDFSKYLSKFTSVASPECVAAVKVGVRAIDALFALGQNEYLATVFNSCNNLTQPLDVWNFKWTIAEAVGSSDQFENPDAWPLNATCAQILNASTPLLGLATAAGAPNGGSSCVDYSYAGMLAPMQDVTSQSRSWQFQCCSEFGFWQSTTTSIFFANDDISADKINAICEQVFGVAGMTPNTTAINDRYGAKNLNATNVLFTNGNFDPWAQLSITQSSGGVQAVTYDAGHCAPMTAPSVNDPPSLVAARAAVLAFLTDLLK